MLQVDIWALGISTIEMAEGMAPRWMVHPMRVIFMISRDPAPRLQHPDRWSLPLHDFVAMCLQKVGPCEPCESNGSLKYPDQLIVLDFAWSVHEALSASCQPCLPSLSLKHCQLNRPAEFS